MRRIFLAAWLLAAPPGFGQDQFDVTGLDGSNGFVLRGDGAETRTGEDLAALGDFNGDGIDDLAVASPNFDFEDFSRAYIVFGQSTSVPALRALSGLGGSGGGLSLFDGRPLSRGPAFGQQVAGGGDLNGDGWNDIAVESDQGVYVFYGQSGPSFTRDVANLDGENGFSVSGLISPTFSSVDLVADLNGDRQGDLLLGAGQGLGAVYAFFGSSLPVAVNRTPAVLSGDNGFAVDGLRMNDNFGGGVVGAGDFNADGLSDFAMSASGNGSTGEDAGYLIYGFDDPLVSRLGINFSFGDDGGFAVTDVGAGASTTGPVGAGGDFNGDGFSDFLLGGPRTSPGQVYVIFGQGAPYPPAVDVADLDGSNGFAIDGMVTGGSRTPFASLGDINADGVADIGIGGSGDVLAYVLFGAASFNASLNLADLDGRNGFVLPASGSGQSFGGAISGAGDLNDDGVADFAVSEAQVLQAGNVRVVYGNGSPRPRSGVVALDASTQATVFDLAQPIYLDADPLAGIAVIDNAAAPAEGEWQYQTGTGWLPFPAGLSDSNALVLDAGDSLRFIPSPGFTGFPGGFTIRLWDGAWRSPGVGVDLGNAIKAFGGFSGPVQVISQPRPDALFADGFEA